MDTPKGAFAKWCTFCRKATHNLADYRSVQNQGPQGSRHPHRNRAVGRSSKRFQGNSGSQAPRGEPAAFDAFEQALKACEDVRRTEIPILIKALEAKGVNPASLSIAGKVTQIASRFHYDFYNDITDKPQLAALEAFCPRWPAATTRPTCTDRALRAPCGSSLSSWNESAKCAAFGIPIFSQNSRGIMMPSGSTTFTTDMYYREDLGQSPFMSMYGIVFESFVRVNKTQNALQRMQESAPVLFRTLEEDMNDLRLRRAWNLPKLIPKLTNTINFPAEFDPKEELVLRFKASKQRWEGSTLFFEDHSLEDFFPERTDPAAAHEVFVGINH